MSIPSAIRRSVRSPAISKDATVKEKSAPAFLRFIFESNPRPINCCTHGTTREFAENPSHPYHIKTSRKLAAFDKSKLHWSVSASIDVSKKKVVRSWVKRRVEEAVRAELKERGWARDGTILEQDLAAGDKGSSRASSPLKGALKIYMAPDRRKEVVTATGDEVRRDVWSILEQVVLRQAFNSQKRSTQNDRAKQARKRRPGTPRGPGQSQEAPNHGRREP